MKIVFWETIKFLLSVIAGGVGGSIVAARIQSKHLSHLQNKKQIFDTKIQPAIITLEKVLINTEIPSEIDVELLAELSARLKMLVTEINNPEFAKEVEELKIICINYRRCFENRLNDPGWQQSARILGEKIESSVKKIVSIIEKY
ncbi:MAG: hypothetical protein DRP84_11800 [Spirochaetes bacterium]|nr:MAG: hypothetical protein DRP84_11800 [Spirochaetota bacterium]RKX99113.1 MAG: hypothetical protein DRP55_07805 [Spirochaetota bacterium]